METMEYKILTKYIQEYEIKILLNCIFPEAKLRYFKRQLRHNYIQVYFVELGSEQIRRVDFLPDDIYVHREGEVLDGEPIGDGDKLNIYQQFTVAKGYSHIWNGNPFCI